MPNRTDYLNDLASHPGSLAVEVQARIQAPTVNAVETQFRKLRDAGLVAIEETSPRKYRLTEQGNAQLARLSEAGSGQSAPSTQDAGPQKGGEHNTAFENPRTLPDPMQTTPRSSRVKEILERVKGLTEEHTETTTAKPHACVRELLSLERGISDMPRRELRKLRDSLRERINDEGVCEKVSLLVEAEIRLCEQNDGWWSDEDSVKRLETEIAQLKGALSLVEEGTNEEK